MIRGQKPIAAMTVVGASVLTLGAGYVIAGLIVLVAGIVVIAFRAVWNYRRGRQVGEIPADTKQHISSTFRLSEDSLRGLRFVARRSRFSGAPVRLIRVFDPTRLVPGSKVKSFQDMDAERDSVQFDGHVFSNPPRSIPLADQR